MTTESDDLPESDVPATTADANRDTDDDSSDTSAPEVTDTGETQPRKSRTGLIVGGSVVAVIAVAAVAAVVLLSGPTKAPSEMTAAQASALADGLNARDPEKLADVLADPAVAKDPAVAAAIIADGESVSIDPASLEVEGDVAFVQARIAGPEPSTLTFFLVDVDGTWKIAGSTAPKPDAAP